MGSSTVTVTVPATTANLGAGFDCLGAALSLHNQFAFSLLPDKQPRSLVIEAMGLEAERVATNKSNLAYQSFLKLYEHLEQEPPAVRLEIMLQVPLARGLGSSATAIVGGLMGANTLAGSPLSSEQILALAIALEGHPDNVVPALMGGCRLSASDPRSGTDHAWTICDVPWHEEVIPVIAIPNFELSTTAARQVLPAEYSRADAVFNVAHLGLLLRGVQTGRADWLRTALHDRIHQPYRQTLIKGFDQVQKAALDTGAYGLVISGSGPTLLALAPPEHMVAVETAMAEAWIAEGVSVHTRILQIDEAGAVVKA
ncbi:MAG: homoserine kinase [Oscillatoriophycideae cyanobacterium NC_groundwater_1537_Pr4_S-0.65um_50_18]|nr:homoserine kinase [Oscillatoriophycideae cyanobacterium NC_groundwater_1537_Pr4_S-0.65um_50_18]